MTSAAFRRSQTQRLSDGGFSLDLFATTLGIKKLITSKYINKITGITNNEGMYVFKKNHPLRRILKALRLTIGGYEFEIPIDIQDNGVNEKLVTRIGADVDGNIFLQRSVHSLNYPVEVLLVELSACRNYYSYLKFQNVW